MNKNKALYLFIFFAATILFFTACSEDKKDIPDISDVEVDGTFSKDAIFLFDEKIGPEKFETLVKIAPTFSKIYFQNILFPGDTIHSDSHFLEKIQVMAKDTFIKNLNDTLHLAYDNEVNEIWTKFNTAFKYLKFYFPEYKTPNVYLCNTLFNYQKFIFSDGLERDAVGLGVEMFLNDYYDYKLMDPSNPAFSDYITRTFNRDHMVKKGLDLIVDELLGAPSGSRLMDQMIRNGKKLYILEKLLPYAADNIILEYSEDQVTWCRANELEIWGFFLDQNLFYESSPIKIVKFLNDSPNSPGMPQEAPGRTANYLGLQIVKKYMKKNPELSLQDLIAINDAQLIVDQSGYKPKRK